MTTSSLAAPLTSWTESFGRSWNDFWFRPSDPTLVSLLRIGVGLIALLHLASYRGDLVRWFGADGLLPMETVDALLGGGVIPSHLFLLGRLSGNSLGSPRLRLDRRAFAHTRPFSRASAAATAIATLAIANRAPIISGQVEPVLIFMLLYLCIAPAGAKFALDTLLRPLCRGYPLSLFAPRNEPSVFANLSLRLMQVHFAAFYLMMALSKTYGDAWWDGAAAWHLLAQTHSRPMDLSSLRGNEFLLNACTHFIAWTQLLFPFLVWNRFSRPVILAAAALMWLLLLPLTGLTSFCLLMLVGLLCFLPTDTFVRQQVVAKA